MTSLFDTHGLAVAYKGGQWAQGGILLRPSGVYDLVSNKSWVVFGASEEGTPSKHQNPYIIEIDHNDNNSYEVYKVATLPTGGELDNHAAPIVQIGPDGTLYVMSSKDSLPLRWWRSTSPRDASSWTAEQVLLANCTYPNLYQWGANFLLIYRGGGTQGRGWTAARLGIDGNKDLSIIDSEVVLDDSVNNFWYVDIAQNREGKVSFAFNWQIIPGDASQRAHLYYCEYDPTSKVITNIEGNEHTKPLDRFNYKEAGSDCTVWESVPLTTYTQPPSIALSVGQPHIIQTEGPRNSSPQRLWHFRYSGTGVNWIRTQIAADLDNAYSPLKVQATLDGQIHAYATKESIGPGEFQRGGNLYRWVSEDNGAIWSDAQLIDGSRSGYVADVYNGLPGYGLTRAPWPQYTDAPEGTIRVFGPPSDDPGPPPPPVEASPYYYIT